jgi:DNA-binding transcriptional LysR family regulator
MDKVRRLEMVVRAADLGGFAAAAKYMNITPSAVSRGIAELERKLRISIFKRSTRHIQLTEEGRDLYHSDLDVLERLAATEVTANAVDKQVRGTIRVGIMPPLSRHVIMPQLAGFLDAFRICGSSFTQRKTPGQFRPKILTCCCTSASRRLRD